jgi:hypothetical protein
MQVPAVQIPANHVSGIGPEKDVLPLIAVVPDPLQIFEMVLHTLEVMGLKGRPGNVRGKGKNKRRI